MRFAHHISLRKALYDVKNEFASKTTSNFLHFYIKKGQPQMIEIVLFSFAHNLYNVIPMTIASFL